MTNNPTIDGVSRELLQRAWVLLDESQPGRTCNELRALLDAPAVERQELVQMASMPVDRCHDVRAKMIIAFNEAKNAGGDLDDALDAAYRSALRFSPAPQDFADQQSTIARLEAQLNNAIDLDFQRRERIAQLESEKEFAAATYQAARDRIAELESTQPLDNPTAYLRNEGEPNNLVVCGFDHPEAFKVFMAKPAPVAVVLPERKDENDDCCGNDPTCWFPQGWNACLDATAALNTPKPTEWHDVAGDDEGFVS